MFLLSAMLREAEPLWLDGFALTDAADLHALLKTGFPLYAARCVLAAAALPSLDKPTAIQVPAGAVGALYCATRMPDGFPEDVVAAAEKRFPLGLYSHTAAYFVLGAIKDPQRPPELTKIVLMRRDLVSVEKALRDLRDKVIAHRANGAEGADGLNSSLDSLASELRRLCTLLAQGFCDTAERAEVKIQARAEMSEREREKDSSPTVAVDRTGGAGTVRCTFPSAAGSVEVAVPLEEAFLLDLSDVLSCDKDWQPRERGQVCALLRGALGYRDE
jgi:hypothetical protein